MLIRAQVNVSAACPADQEAYAGVSGWPLLWSMLTPACRLKVEQYMCLFVFNECAGGSVYNRPCDDQYNDVKNTCTAEWALIRGIAGTIFGAAPPGITTNCIAFATPDITRSIPRCETYQGTVCAGVQPANTKFYIPTGMVQSDLEAKVQPAHFLFAVAPVSLSGSRVGCREALAKFVCGAAFMPCADITIAALGQTVKFPRFPCRSVCNNYESQCAPLISMLTALPGTSSLLPDCDATTRGPGHYVNCSGTLLSAGEPDFPIQNTTFGAPVQGTPLVTDCDNTAVGSVNFVCPAPLVVPDRDDAARVNGGSCSTPCPSFLFSESSYVMQDYIMVFGTILSTICVLFVFTMWVMYVGGHVVLPFFAPDKIGFFSFCFHFPACLKCKIVVHTH